LSDAADVDVDVAAAKRLILSWLISHQWRRRAKAGQHLDATDHHQWIDVAS
jgi:hypothetical protein